MAVAGQRQLHAKALGAFYTPATIAEALAVWLVRDGTERLLEPSVGDGSLVLATIRRAKELRGENARVSFVACDINPAAIDAVMPKLPKGSEAHAIDFLQLDPMRTGSFDGVIANPPFTRNHSLAASRRIALRERFKVFGAAGLWVHFLLHAIEFLSHGGRLASVIPASGLFSKYGQTALKRLASEFSQVEIHHIIDKPLWSNGADERGALFLAEGYRKGSSELPVPTQWSAHGKGVDVISDRIDEFDQLMQISEPLNSIATLSIGAVTGCNSVFLLDDMERCSMGVPISELRPVVSRVRHLSGLQISADELLSKARAGEKTWILAPDSLIQRGSGTRRQLAKITKDKRKSTVWFTKRTPWWRVQLGEPCHAIFTYMNDEGPKLVLANSGVYCTNTLHRVRFNRDRTHDEQMAAALTMISTFGQLAAERIGRSYGGGVLKFELMEARRMPVLCQDAHKLGQSFRLADQALRMGDKDAARAIADQALLFPQLGCRSAQVIREMNAEIMVRRAVRHG